MSRKWQRIKRWDDEHLSTPALVPVKWLLRALSSITLAVILLVFVALYGTLASVPVGMFAAIPTWLVIALTVVAPVVVGAAIPVSAILRFVPRRLVVVRLAAALGAVIAAVIAVSALWGMFVWPALHYDPANGTGLRLFPGFIERFGAVTVRRLPALEMSELEFYSWWPLRVVLLLFVLNMIVATVRRIEFTFKNLGVLTVHAGIIVMSLGSVYYQRFKQEGNTILLAASSAGPVPAAAGDPGPSQSNFYDNTRVTLWVSQQTGPTGFPRWEQRVLRGVPRYNAYGLDAADANPGTRLTEVLRTPEPPLDAGDPLVSDQGRTLDLRVGPGGGTWVDPTLEFRVVGYAPYAVERPDWILHDTPPSGVVVPEPVRLLEFATRDPARPGEIPMAEPRAAFLFDLHPTVPAMRIVENAAFSVEYTMGMPAERRAALLSQLQPGSEHGLVIEMLGDDGGVVRSLTTGVRERDLLSLGDSGWSIGVESLLDQPPFPIITAGYEGASSSVAVLRVTTPEGETFTRYVYHRFPEINQDLLDSQTPEGRPARRDPDARLRIRYVDASDMLRVYIDEAEDGATTTIVRAPGESAMAFAGTGFRFVVGEDGRTVIEPGLLSETDRPGVGVAPAGWFEHAERVAVPLPVQETDRDAQLIGTHAQAMLAVEVSQPATGWSRVVWLPFSQFMFMGSENERVVSPPGMEPVRLAFSRLSRPLPGFTLSLVDFEMLSYDHRGAPRDFQSVVRVRSTEAGTQRVETPSGETVEIPGPSFEYTHVTKLNAPLKAPFMWSDDRNVVANSFGAALAGLNPRQFKLSQSGWDQQGWQQSQKLADQGLIERPVARFTILGVGNNPGIHIIAIGGIMMGLGTPWAFYVKPWLVRRERDRLAARARAAVDDHRASKDPGRSKDQGPSEQPVESGVTA